MTTWRSQATKPGTYDSTPIDGLRVHLVVDGTVACSAHLLPMFGNGDGPITCARCMTKAADHQAGGMPACTCCTLYSRDEDGTDEWCEFCTTQIDVVYGPCPVVGFGCGTGATLGPQSCDCCTPEQWAAAAANQQIPGGGIDG